MERFHHLHLLVVVALLLASGIAEAQDDEPLQNAMEATCEHNDLSSQLALNCLPAAGADDDAPPDGTLNTRRPDDTNINALCCRTVGHAVHIDSGFRCLCAAAAEQQLVIGGLNSTRLLAIYAACGGLRPVDSRLASACLVMSQSGDYMSKAACDPANLADQLTRYCRSDAPTPQCCEPVVATVDLSGGGEEPCLCRVLAEPQLIAINATGLLAMYTACGGLRSVGADFADGCSHPIGIQSTTPAAVMHDLRP